VVQARSKLGDIAEKFERSLQLTSVIISFQSKLVVCIVAYRRCYLQYNFMDPGGGQFPIGGMPPTWALLYLLQYRFGQKIALNNWLDILNSSCNAFTIATFSSYM